MDIGELQTGGRRRRRERGGGGLCRGRFFSFGFLLVIESRPFVADLSFPYPLTRPPPAPLPDNIDMSKVNRTMFGAGTLAADADADDDDGAGRGRRGANGALDDDGGFRFDVDRATLERLASAGLAREVVRQADGSEYELGGGERKFSMLGRDVSDDELREAGMVGGGAAPKGRTRYDAGDDALVETDDVRIIASNAGVVDVPGTSEVGEEGEEGEDADNVPVAEGIEDAGGDVASTKPRDPIDMLTVARLKEVLRSQGLKTSGTKGVLRDRLRGHVKSLLREE